MCKLQAAVPLVGVGNTRFVPAVTILLGVGLLPIRIPNFVIEFATPHRHRSMKLRTDPVIGISLGVIKYARNVRMSELVL